MISSTALINDEVKRANKPKVKQETRIITQNFNQSLPIKKEEVRIFLKRFYFIEN